MSNRFIEKSEIVIIDYGLGNLMSILNKFRRIKVPAMISKSLSDIENAKKLILPGVGQYAYGMKKLNEFGLIDILNKKVLDDKIPILGICLGMHLFTDFGYEGQVKGLGWIKGEPVLFNHQTLDKTYKVPHMGWNTLEVKKNNPLLKGLNTNDMFYFVHKYHLACQHSEDIIGTTTYGYEFVSCINKGNIYGTQFHPEKSHESGFNLIKNFIDL